MIRILIPLVSIGLVQAILAVLRSVVALAEDARICVGVVGDRIRRVVRLGEAVGRLLGPLVGLEPAAIVHALQCPQGLGSFCWGRSLANPVKGCGGPLEKAWNKKKIHN